MGIIETSLIAVGLAMDAFSVAICKGLAMKKVEIKKVMIVALYFGIFQCVMPIIGFLVGSTFAETIERFDHWIAFILLGIIGANMIAEAFDKEECKSNEKIDFISMVVLALATSIDALTVGITFSFFDSNIILAAILIGVITFVLSAIGVVIGNKFGDKFKIKAEVIGGVILVIMGIKILVEHLGII